MIIVPEDPTDLQTVDLILSLKGHKKSLKIDHMNTGFQKASSVLEKWRHGYVLNGIILSLFVSFIFKRKNKPLELPLPVRFEREEYYGTFRSTLFMHSIGTPINYSFLTII